MLFGSGRRLALILVIVLLTAFIHIFRLGSYLQGDLFNLYYSYFSDILLPFTFYFLICLNEINLPFLRHWAVKATIVFLLPIIAETAQFFGFPVLGSTFDPLDYVAYAIGALAAAAVDVCLFSKLFSFWNEHKNGSRLSSFTAMTLT